MFGSSYKESKPEQSNTNKYKSVFIRNFFSFYLIIAILLSMTIFFRLFITTFDDKLVFDIVGFLNVVLYDLYFYVIPIITVFLLSSFTNQNEEKLPSNRKILLKFSNICLILSLSILLLFLESFINNPIFFLVIPVLITTLITIFLKKSSEPITVFKKKVPKKVTALLLAVIFILPYLSVFLGTTYVSYSLNDAENDRKRIQFISGYLMDSHTSFWGPFGIYYSPHRVGDNFLKFWLEGVSACGDMAEITMVFIDSLDLDNRRIDFCGEDHAFVEVFLDGKWLVVDPGYRITLATQRERGQARLKDMGGLSYVVTNIGDDPLDLTENYVITDQITIKILQNGKPLPDAIVTLKHEFHGAQFGLPSFETDENGTLIISLGPMNYTNTSIEPAEPFYWIWVNGEKTNTQVTSSGSGKSTYYEIQLN